MTTRRPRRNTPGGAPQLTAEVEAIAVGDAPPAAKPQTPVPRKSGSKDDRPRYQQMARMEARIRPDQQRALSELRRQVAANRAVKDERITDNTLLRVAVDLLLAHRELLEGNTEDELRASVVSE